MKLYVFDLHITITGAIIFMAQSAHVTNHIDFNKRS